MLPISNLFARLAEGGNAGGNADHAARVTVVTPNTRLAQALQAEFDAYQLGKNRTSWEAADIVPFQAFVQRLYEDALYSGTAAELPSLLTPAQEQWLWQEAVSSAELLSVAATADQCRQAWKLAHEWRTGIGKGNEDSVAFTAWSETYRKKTAGEIDAARLPDLLPTLFKSHGLKLPALLVSYGFDIVTPQARDFLAACAAQGVELAECKPAPKNGLAVKASFVSAKEELEAAAAWARGRLENRGRVENRCQTLISHSGSGGTGNQCLTPIFPRIGVVVPDLEKRRAEVVRVFSRVLSPGYQLPGAGKGALPFNISIGIPLDRYPVVALALSLLEFSHNEIEFEKVSALVRSPFLGGAETELAARAQLDVRLRRKLDASVSLPKLIANIDGAPVLRSLLEKIFELNGKSESQKSPAEWARHFSALLDAAGFPGERVLDSDEFQARAKWHEALGELSKLERISQPLSFSQAFNQIRRICAGTTFQPQSGDLPIQVLGVLESAGTQFDHLWVSGLSDQAWPLAARTNPFIPLALQRKAGIPQASAESSLELDRRITEGWKGAAGEAVFSWFEKEDDRELSPSPLIASIARAEVPVPVFPRYRDQIFLNKKITSLEDSKAPPVQSKTVRGGTRVLSDQAACPFRAFAAWRLDAKPLEAPGAGLDAAQRGSLIHALMKHLWMTLKASLSLQESTEPAIEAAAAAAVREFGLEGRFAVIERERLARLARDWLAIEKARPPFEVVSIEEKRRISIAGLEFDARIDRMDKLSVENGGGHVLIDYKTSRAPSPRHWEPPRPDDPQLPLYAISAKEDIAAVAFAKLRPGDMRFIGISRENDLLPEVKKPSQKQTPWQQLSKIWKLEAESLGKAFAAGEARVDPKRELATCRNCALHTLCRVYEKTNPLIEGEAAE